MTVLAPASLRTSGLFAAMGGEGLRLFFPLAALHTALWPLLWVLLWRLGLPLAEETAPGQWHAQEMLVGSFGAALIGFLTSALPEWSDTRRLEGRPLFLLAGLWMIGRLAGLAGAEAAIPVAALADQAWMFFLLAYVAKVSWTRRTTNFTGFVLLLLSFQLAAALLRYGMWSGAIELAETAIRICGLALLGLLGLALARITVPVTNLILDPSEETSPYRPHPGRANLAAGLTALVILAELANMSEVVRGYLMLAAGAAFLDRVAEGFIGREGLKWELAGLWLSSAMAGTGLVVSALHLIGLPLPWLGGLHLMLMGGLGLGVLQVLSIAGLLHTGQPLSFSAFTRAALWLLFAAVAARATPEFLPDLPLSGSSHGLAALLWAMAFLLWLRTYLPLLWSPATLNQESC